MELTTQTIPSGYKQTEIGTIPVDWNIVKAGDVGRFRGGNGFPTRLQGATSGEYPFFKVSDMNNAGNDTFMFDANNWISDGVKRQINATIFPAGSIIFAKVGAAVFLERKKILTRPSCIDNNLAALVLDRARTDVRFIHYVLHSIKFGALVSTTALPSLSGSVLSQIALPLPLLDEQVAIASALSDTDALISKLETLIQKKKLIKQGAMQKLLTGKRRLPGFSGEWEKSPLKNLVKIPVSDGPHLTPRFLNEGVPFLSVNNLVDGKICLKDLRYISQEDHEEFSKKCRPQKGDLLLGKAASVGTAAVADLDFEFNIWSPIALIRLKDEYDVRYFCYSLQSDLIIRQIKVLTNSSSQGNLGMGDIEKLEFNVPSKNEQKSIAMIIFDMDAEIEKLESQLKKFQYLRQGMMQVLLTGKIRLI